MLKFNIKEHKLKELEKYGFKNGSYDNYENIINKDMSIIIDNETYNVVIYKRNTDYSSITELNILYDLIKAGLIIKE